MVKFAANDIIPSVYRFLLECGLDDAAKLIKKIHSVENVIHNHLSINKYDECIDKWYSWKEIS